MIKEYGPRMTNKDLLIWQITGLCGKEDRPAFLAACSDVVCGLAAIDEVTISNAIGRRDVAERDVLAPLRDRCAITLRYLRNEQYVAHYTDGAAKCLEIISRWLGCLPPVTPVKEPDIASDVMARTAGTTEHETESYSRGWARAMGLPREIADRGLCAGSRGEDKEEELEGM